MKKVLLLLIAGLFLIQFSSFGQSKLNKKPAPSQEASICTQLTPQVQKARDQYIVSLKSDVIDDFVLIPELDQENPLYQRRNRITTKKDGKYLLVVKMKAQKEICSSEITLSKSASRWLSADAGKIWFSRFPQTYRPLPNASAGERWPFRN